VNHLDFLNLASAIGIIIIGFEYFLKTFQFPRKKENFLEKFGTANGTERFLDYTRKFQIIIMILMIITLTLAIIGIIQSFGVF